MNEPTPGITVTFKPACSRCHRPLTDPVSVAAGMGPVCRAKEGIVAAGAASHAGAARGPAGRARWTFWLEGRFVLLEDQGGAVSVTNDAERVVLELASRCPLEGRRVLYRDSMGRWDELVVQAGRFVRFAPVGVTGNYREALAVAAAIARPWTIGEALADPAGFVDSMEEVKPGR